MVGKNDHEAHCALLAAAAHAAHHVAHRAGSHDALHHLAGAFKLLEEFVDLWK